MINTWFDKTSSNSQNLPCFLIAEIGANHDGNIERAKELVNIAAEAGADAVKFQTYTANELLADQDREVEWGPPDARVKEPVGKMFDRIHLPRKDHQGLFSLAQSLGLIAFSTPFSPSAVDFLDSINNPLYKVASSDVSNFPLLAAIAEKRKPVILSSGKSTLEEIDEAVQFLQERGIKKLALLHCVSTYPALDEDCHLRVITSLQARYPELFVGLSDHSPGTLAPCIAVSLGAKVVEKHITYDKRAWGPDHHFSLDPEELRDLVKAVRRTELMLGSGEKRVLDSEKPGRVLARPSIIAAQNISKGEIITAKMLKVCRPGTGLAPKLLDKVIGQSCAQDIGENTPILLQHLKGEKL